MYFSRKAVSSVDNELQSTPASGLPGSIGTGPFSSLEPGPSGSLEPSPSGPLVSMRARIAVYDDMLSAPRIIDIEPAPLLIFIEAIAKETYEKAQQLGGRLPYTAIREIAENFIHADFKECTVSILDRGDTIRFSDRGPGIEKKLLVLQPGVSSADDQMRRYIKGVGSGFPIVREYLSINQGSLRIDDNATEGAVITLSLAPTAPLAPSAPAASAALEAQPFAPTAIDNSRTSTDPLSPFTGQVIEDQPAAVLYQPPAFAQGELPPTLDSRSISALRVIAELGAAGPTDLVAPLSISAATAHRLLLSLESDGLLEKASNRKRMLSSAGLILLQRLGGY